MPDQKLKVRGNDPLLHERKMRGDCRVLDLNKQGLWQWKYATDKIIFYDPDDKRIEAPIAAVLNVTQAEYDALQFDWRDESIPITPADLSDYVRRMLLGLHERSR
ncbi:MAG: hypothetical protein EOO77_45830 [Oxalobacteraceae bacterium]|jgi:hypothetical protein|nr:MAG: hypothetical protein EOO77_45830 [Oxalobacteraceae bacterium]